MGSFISDKGRTKLTVWSKVDLWISAHFSQINKGFVLQAKNFDEGIGVVIDTCKYIANTIGKHISKNIYLILLKEYQKNYQTQIICISTSKINFMLLKIT